MKIYQTKLQKDDEYLATELEQLRILQVRGSLEKKEQKKLKNLEAGEQGEQAVLDEINKYGKKHWIVFRNLWLDSDNTWEIDSLLITTSSIHVLEVKNYEGFFQYKNGICMLNDWQMPNNCVAQAQKNFVNTQNIIRKVAPEWDVSAALVFAGKNNQVQLDSEVAGIDIINPTQLKSGILNIANIETQKAMVLNPNPIFAEFDRLSTHSPYLPDSISSQRLKKLRKGIYCKKCLRFDVDISQKFVRCQCGHVELRDCAMIRTIDEYMKLTQKQEVTRREVEDFLSGQASENYTLSILKRYFEKKSSYKKTCYQKANS